MAISILSRKSSFGIEYQYTITDFSTDSVSIPNDTVFLSLDLNQIFYKDLDGNISGVFQGDYNYIEVQPAPSDIRVLTSQYYELIPAPGVGKYIDVFRIISESYPGDSPATTPYNYSSYKGIYFSQETSGFSTNYISAISLSVGALWTGNDESYAISVPLSIYNLPINTNKPLNVAIDNGDNPLNDATVGDHLVTFRIWYKIRSITTS
jgi:hypothetical protein